MGNDAEHADGFPPPWRPRKWELRWWSDFYSEYRSFDPPYIVTEETPDAD